MRPRRAERRIRAGGALAHLLLVGVLALGVFLMHAVGHPEGAGDTRPSGTATVTTVTTAAHHTGEGTGDDGGSDARHEPGSGMDMTTLCVAVLGVWLLAGLVRAALARRPDWLAVLLARLVPALGPHAPPPRPPDLAQLSILRI
ncbi:DUF6153 family protein [Streptomyces sp. NPDC056144]|uniref:DUF6153 family protein n=1 Tax=unclassified Streptomyces TaxID=2593676 RepID=UPI0035E184F0